IERPHSMARVHDEDQADQRRSRRDVRPEKILPGALDVARDRGVAIARKMDAARASGKLEEIDLLRAPWRAAGERETRSACERVDRARLARVRATGERDFGRTRRRQLLDRGGGAPDTNCRERGGRARG